MKKYKIILISLIITLSIFVALFVRSIYTRQSILDILKITNNWRKVEFKNNRYSLSEKINIDLDNDGQEEKVFLDLIIPITDGKEIIGNQKGKHYISINNEYLAIKEETSFDKLKSYFYIVDLNDDGILELIFEGANYMISPINNSYYIFNYTNGKLKQLGVFSIIGSLETSFEVNGNKIRQEYSPYESKPGYTTIKEIELTVN